MESRKAMNEKQTEALGMLAFLAITICIALFIILPTCNGIKYFAGVRQRDEDQKMSERAFLQQLRGERMILEAWHSIKLWRN